MGKLQLTRSGQVQYVILASTADRRLNILPIDTSSRRLRPLGLLADSPILSFLVVSERFIVFSTIAGGLLAYDPCTETIVAKRKDHTKYTVQVITTAYRGSTYVLQRVGTVKFFFTP